MSSKAAVGNRQSAVDRVAGSDCRLATADCRRKIVAGARAWIGTPYRHQGALKGVGCDCLGLIVGVWRELGGAFDGSVPPYTPDWAEANGRETLAEGFRKYLTEIDPREADAGDVVLFRWRKHLPAKHTAIMTARDRIVHAQQNAAVTEVAVSDWWRRRMAYAFSFSTPLNDEPLSRPSDKSEGHPLPQGERAAETL